MLKQCNKLYEGVVFIDIKHNYVAEGRRKRERNTVYKKRVIGKQDKNALDQII